MDLTKIFANNEQWIADHLRVDPKFFDKLAKGQSPEILYIGCADSRVTAEDLMGAAPGEIFVHRNIANLVPNTDLSAASVIHYAVSRLGVKHVVVCGHYDCGGVKAAMLPENMGLLNPWLRNIRDVFRLHQDELGAITDTDERYDRLVELNVREQCINVLKIIDVQIAIRDRGLQVHGWVFDLRSGKLVDLKIDFNEVTERLASIYRFQ